MEPLCVAVMRSCSAAVAGARSCARARRVAAMRRGDVVERFLKQHGLAEGGAAERADLAALGVGREQVDEVEAGDEKLGFGRLVGVLWRRLVDGALCS